MSKPLTITEVLKSEMQLTQRTKTLLKTLKKKGFVKFEYDDGYQDAVTLSEIKEIAGDVGYEVWEQPNVNAILVVRDC